MISILSDDKEPRTQKNEDLKHGNEWITYHLNIDNYFPFFFSFSRSFVFWRTNFNVFNLLKFL